MMGRPRLDHRSPPSFLAAVHLLFLYGNHTKCGRNNTQHLSLKQANRVQYIYNVRNNILLSENTILACGSGRLLDFFTKQLLLYDSAVPASKRWHLDRSLLNKPILDHSRQSVRPRDFVLESSQSNKGSIKNVSRYLDYCLPREIFAMSLNSTGSVRSTFQCSVSSTLIHVT